MGRKLKLIMLLAVIPVALALMPIPAAAQTRGGAVIRGGGGGSVAVSGGAVVRGGAGAVRGGSGGYWHGGGGHVIVGGYWGPYWGWGGGYWWDPLWYGPYWGYPYYRYWDPGYYDNSAELRIEVKPKDAQVYVDGYYAGIVDDFDGVFQRLHVRPGRHELTLYLPGYRAVRQNLYLSVDSDSKVKFNMVPLGPGESNEPPPQPVAPPEVQHDYGNEPPPRAPRPSAVPEAPLPPSHEMVVGQGFGSLVIRVQPSGAEVVVDGERWQGPEGAERLVVQVAEGPHHVEVRKEGYVPFSMTVNVRSGATEPINVSLPKQ